jgi:hypothetical protein
MYAQEIIDWIVRGVVGVGVPSAAIKYILDWKRNRAKARSEDAQADVDQATVPDKLRSSSVVTMEAERLALTESFRADREIKDQTIAFLRLQIDAAQIREAEKDAKILTLQHRVEELLSVVRQQVEELSAMADQLRDLHGSPGDV